MLSNAPQSDYIMRDVKIALIHPGIETDTFNMSFRSGLMKVVEQHPHITLIERTTQHNTATAIQYANEIAGMNVDVVILNHLDQRAGYTLVKPFAMNRIPVISVEIEFPMTIFLGVDNRMSGNFAAREAGNWIHDHWNNRLDRVLIGIDQRVTSTHRQRIDAVIETLQTLVHVNNDQILYIDTNLNLDVTYNNTYSILKRWKDHRRILMVAIGDTVVRGMLDAARDLDREEEVIAVSFDGTSIALEEFRRPNSRLLVSPTFQPSHYGKHLINLVKKIIADDPIANHNLIPPLCITSDNYEYIMMSSTH